MDQVKEFLRQCVKYRFWISVTVAALFAVIAYFLGAGPVQKKADDETKAITQAKKDVEPFISPGVPNGDYQKLVDEKTGILNKDVSTAWKDLYNRQAPLLTWPEQVDKRFREWGRQWPEKVAPSAVSVAIVDYIMAYPDYVDKVYKGINPFDYETGKGVIAAPPKEQLLQPAPFDVNALPDLGKIWAAQERLWVQRSVLEVVSQVNKNAKDWDSAIIKQINFLTVGSAEAQDQKSQAQSLTLTEAEPITAPGEEAPEDPSAGGGGAGGGPRDAIRESMGARGGMMAGPGGMMGGAGAGAAPDTISFIKPEKGAYKILPVLISVLIDQDHIQDLLVDLENSPMAIQVMDFTLERPSARVTKPEKGENMMGGMMGGYYGKGGGESMMRGMMGMGKGSMYGYGGRASETMRGMMGMGGPMAGAYGGGYGGPGMGAGAARTGTDKRSTDRSKSREEEKKTVQASEGLSLFDPHYDIVELKVYGQARFYDAPPADAPAETSPGEQATEKPDDAPKPADAPKADAPKPAEAPKAEAPKADTPKPAEAPKADTPKPAEAPKADAAKPAEAPKADAPKTPEPTKDKAPGA